MAFASEKGLLAPVKNSGCVFTLGCTVEWLSLKGSPPNSEVSPPRAVPMLAPRARLSWCRLASLSNMPLPPSKSGLVSALDLGLSFFFMLPPMPDAENMSFLFSLHCGPRLRGTPRVAQILIMRSLIVRLLSSRTGEEGGIFLRRIRLYCALTEAMTLDERGVGPMLSRCIIYAPFSSFSRGGSTDSGESGVSRVLRLLCVLLFQSHNKRTSKPATAKPPPILPATAADLDE